MAQALQRPNYRRLALLLLLTFGMAVILICVNRSPSQLLDPRIFTAYMARSAVLVLIGPLADACLTWNLSLRHGMTLAFLSSLILNGASFFLIRGGLNLTDLGVFAGLSVIYTLGIAWIVTSKRRSNSERRIATGNGSPESHITS
jgi:hypothetical protein